MDLRALCKSRSVRPVEAARQMGVDFSVVYRWYRGETRPDGDNLVKLLDWAAGEMSIAEAMTKLSPLSTREAAASVEARDEEDEMKPVPPALPSPALVAATSLPELRVERDPEAA